MNPYSQQDIDDDVLEMVIKEIDVGSSNKGPYVPITLKTTRGEVDYRYFKVPDAKHGVIFVGDAQAEWSSPGNGLLYPLIGQDLQDEGISSLWVRYRRSTNLIESILDVLAGVYFLRSQHCTSISIVGHSFGGAVAIQAAASSGLISNIAVLGTQGYGTEAALRLPEKCSALFVHSLDDEILSISHSIKSFNLIPGTQKEIMLLNKTNHNFDNSIFELKEIISNWFIDKLA